MEPELVKPGMKAALLMVAALLVALYLLVGPGLPEALGQTAGNNGNDNKTIPLDKDTAYDLQLAFNEYQQKDRDNNNRRAQMEQQLRQALERDQLELRDLAKAYNELLQKAREAAGVGDNCGPDYKKRVWDCQQQPGVAITEASVAPTPEKDKNKETKK